MKNVETSQCPPPVPSQALEPSCSSQKHWVKMKLSMQLGSAQQHKLLTCPMTVSVYSKVQGEEEGRGKWSQEQEVSCRAEPQRRAALLRAAQCLLEGETVRKG